MGRTVEKFNKDVGKWESVEFESLKDGDIFRFFDGDERYVNEKDGNNVWIAKGEPYLNENGIWTIKTIY